MLCTEHKLVQLAGFWGKLTIYEKIAYEEILIFIKTHKKWDVLRESSIIRKTCNVPLKLYYKTR